MEFLEAGREDIPGIQRVARATWRATYDDILGTDTVETSIDSNDFYATDTLESMLLSPDAFLFVALEEHTVHGVIGATLTDAIREENESTHDQTVEITVMCVDPSMTRLGVGTDLFETATQSLPNNVAGLTVRYLTENESANGFFDALGFEQIDTGVSSIGGHDHEFTLAAKSH